MQCGGNGLDCSEVWWYLPGLQCSTVVMSWITVQCGGNGPGLQCRAVVMNRLQCSAVVMACMDCCEVR
jgi:hypothetical protein